MRTAVRREAATLLRYGPQLAVAVTVGLCLAWLARAGAPPLSDLGQSPGGIVALTVAPIVVALVGTWVWPARFRGPIAVSAPAVGEGMTSVAQDSTPELGVLSRDKICPRCAESVKGAAQACRFCGYEFTAAAATKRATPPPMRAKAILGVAIAIGIFVAAFLVLRSGALTDAESSWCRTHVSAVAASATSLQLDAPSNYESWTKWGEVVGSGLLGDMWDTFTEHADRGNRDRACRSAFELR